MDPLVATFLPLPLPFSRKDSPDLELSSRSTTPGDLSTGSLTPTSQSSSSVYDTTSRIASITSTSLKTSTEEPDLDMEDDSPILFSSIPARRGLAPPSLDSSDDDNLSGLTRTKRTHDVFSNSSSKNSSSSRKSLSSRSSSEDPTDTDDHRSSPRHRSKSGSLKPLLLQLSSPSRKRNKQSSESSKVPSLLQDSSTKVAVVANIVLSVSPMPPVRALEKSSSLFDSQADSQELESLIDSTELQSPRRQSSTSSSFKATPPRLARSSTLMARTAALHHISPPKGRKALSPSKTASYIRSPGHPHNPHDPDKTRLKIDQRLYFTYERFQVAALGCRTTRGATKFNGSHAKIEDWQAAHSSFTPTLYDDMLPRVREAVVEKGFDNLSSPQRAYVRTRLQKDTPTRKATQKDLTDEEYFDRIQPRGRQAKGSFVLTATELLRNSTIEQRRGANRIDCRFEDVLRPLEDEIAERCSTDEAFTPQLAMQEFLTKYQALAESFIDNIETRQEEFERFLTLHEQVNETILRLSKLTPKTTTEDEYKQLIELVDEYLKLKATLSASSKGASSLKDFIRFSQERPMYFNLDLLVKNYRGAEEVSEAIDYFHALKSQLEPSSFDEDQIEYHRQELEIRLAECQTQNEKLKAILAEPISFDKFFFGVYDPTTQTRHTPPRRHVQMQMIQKMEPLQKKTPQTPKAPTFQNSQS